MKIWTRDFGEIEIQPEDIFTFPEGIYAFEEEKEYVLIAHEELSPHTYWLQSVHTPLLCFILFDPVALVKDYAPIFPKGELEILSATTMEDLRYLVIGVIPEDFNQSTVNLKSPLVINMHLRLAKQVICENADYSMKFPLIPKESEDIAYASHHTQAQ